MQENLFIMCIIARFSFFFHFYFCLALQQFLVLPIKVRLKHMMLMLMMILMIWMIMHDIDDMENELYGEGDELIEIKNLTKSEDE